MSIDRDLLWKAWPDGFLVMRGVQSVGGYECVQDGVFIDNHGISAEVKGVDPESGDLLPNVDPADVATWACLLQDLGEALYRGNDVDPEIAPGGLLWRPHRGDRWILEDINGNIGHLNVGQETDDPALALVLARIQLREWAAAPTYGPDARRSSPRQRE